MSKRQPMTVTPEIRIQFAAKVIVSKAPPPLKTILGEPTPCHIWQGEMRNNSAIFRRYPASHWAWKMSGRAEPRITKGGAPVKALLLRKCDEPWCVNPAHYYVNTRQGDADKHPEKYNTKRKMSDSLVVACRKAYADKKASITKLAAKCGVNYHSMWSAITGDSYRHLPGAVPPHPRVELDPLGDPLGVDERKKLEIDERAFISAMAPRALALGVRKFYDSLRKMEDERADAIAAAEHFAPRVASDAVFKVSTEMPITPEFRGIVDDEVKPVKREKMLKE